VKAVLVIELAEVEGSVHRPLLEAMRQQLMRETDLPVHAVAGEDAEMVLDVFAEPERGGGRHVVKVEVDVGHGHGRESSWVLEHSLICRRAGLLDCPLTQLVGIGVEAQHIDAGEHRVWLDQSGVLLWEDA